MAFAQSNSASSTANGNNNTSTIDQDGSSNTAEVVQNGSHNEAMINQGTLDDAILSNNDEARINQTGVGNSAELHSRDGYSGSSASVIYEVDQQGNYNSVRARAFNAPAEGDIDQSGSHNSADLTQHTSDDMYAKLSQSGVGNTADIDQVQGANNAHLEATMEGNHNSMDVTQTNGAWQKLVVSVSGSHNAVNGTLGAHDADQFTEIAGVGNDFDFYQGESSDAGISVSGDYNDIDLMQNGAHNSVFATVPWHKDGIVVSGSHNTVDVTQNSNNNTATVDVSGVGNSATVTQN